MRFKVLVMTTEFFQIAYWCDDEWCFWEDLEEKLQSKSDDFIVAFVPVTFTEDDIFQYVHGSNAFVLRLPGGSQCTKSLVLTKFD